MRVVEVELGERGYPIYIGSEILPQFGQFYRQHELGRRVAVITDHRVGKLYGRVVEEALKDFEVHRIEVPPGEESKSLSVAEGIYTELIERHFDRGSTIVALGGGVVGDLAGFVASTFLRGVAYVQVPTTLLAQTDSSVGGKVAVNHPLGKNLIGTFYQPRFVFVDTEVLRTLPREELLAGLVEVVKYGIIWDEGFFSFLETDLERVLALDPEAVGRVVERCCQIKAEVVGQDEKETSGLRSILNYGHTIGHAIEALTEYQGCKHGQAVMLGMIAAAKMAFDLELLSEEDFRRQENLLRRIDRPKEVAHLAVEEIVERMWSDKKVRDDRIRFVLAERIGRVIVTDQVPLEVITAGIEYIRGGRDGQSARA